MQSYPGIKWQSTDLNIVPCDSRPVLAITFLARLFNDMCSSSTDALFKIIFSFSSLVHVSAFTSNDSVISHSCFVVIVIFASNKSRKLLSEDYSQN